MRRQLPRSNRPRICLRPVWQSLFGDGDGGQRSGGWPTLDDSACDVSAGGAPSFRVVCERVGVTDATLRGMGTRFPPLQRTQGWGVVVVSKKRKVGHPPQTKWSGCSQIVKERSFDQVDSRRCDDRHDAEECPAAPGRWSSRVSGKILPRVGQGIGKAVNRRARHPRQSLRRTSTQNDGLSADADRAASERKRPWNPFSEPNHQTTNHSAPLFGFHNKNKFGVAWGPTVIFQ